MIYSKETKQGKSASIVMSNILLKRVYHFPIIQSIILIFGTLLCFIVAYTRNDVSLYLPFISETGAYSPEKCIFSLTLILGSFIGCITVCSYYMLIRENQLNDTRSFSLLNMGSLCLGLLSMLGLAGVAAFPMTTVFWAHLMFAAMFFVGSAVYFILVSFITYKIEGTSKKLLLRSALSIAIIIFLFLLVILFPLSLVKWHKYNDFIPALKTPFNKGFTLLLLSSVLEWSIVIVIILFTLSFIIDLKNNSFQITVIPETSKNITDTEGPQAPQN